MSSGAAIGTLHGERCSVVLTMDDALWTARAVHGEASSNAAGRANEHRAIVSVWLRRWAKVNDRRIKGGEAPLWPSFTDLVRAHSQPVNPRWSDDPRTAEVDGDLARANPSRATPAQLARRQRIQSLDWESIPLPVRRIVLALLSGADPLTARPAIDFAAPTLWERYGARWSTREERERTLPGAVRAKDAARSSPRGDEYIRVPDVDRGGNVFITDRTGRAGREPYVSGEGAAPSIVKALILGVLGVVAVAAIGGGA